MSPATDTKSVVIKPPAVSGSYERSFSISLPLFGRNLGENLVGVLFVDLLERVGAIVRRHLRDELRGLARRDRLEELGSQLLVEILEHVGGARRTRAPRGTRCSCSRLEQLGDVGEVRRVDLLRLRGEVGRRLVEQRDDVGREQGRDRTVFGDFAAMASWCRPHLVCAASTYLGGRGRTTLKRVSIRQR